MANGKEELITIPANSFNNSSNLDSFLSTVIDGWDTEFIFLGYVSGASSLANSLLGCFSQYAFEKYPGFLAQVWRGGSSGKIQNSITRNNWILYIPEGSVYRVIRNPFTTVFPES